MLPQLPADKANHRARLAGLSASHGVEVMDALATLAGGFLCFLPLTYF